jgi:hypothetical protein
MTLPLKANLEDCPPSIPQVLRRISSGHLGSLASTESGKDQPALHTGPPTPPPPFSGTGPRAPVASRPPAPNQMKRGSGWSGHSRLSSREGEG